MHVHLWSYMFLSCCIHTYVSMHESTELFHLCKGCSLGSGVLILDSLASCGSFCSVFMTACAAAMGALSVVCMWVICTFRWPKMALIKTVIMMLNEKEKIEIYQCLQPKKKLDDESDGKSSSWSLVSDDEGLSENHPSSETMPTTRVSSSSLGRAGRSLCGHVRTTTKGSNAFQRRLRCLDCECLLQVTPVERNARQHTSGGIVG